MLAFDLGSSYTTVTSDICTKCHSKVYKPATSETEKNLGTQWEIDIEQATKTLELKVIAFTDEVCLGEGDALCASDFKFYSIYEENGLSQH